MRLHRTATPRPGVLLGPPFVLGRPTAAVIVVDTGFARSGDDGSNPAIRRLHRSPVCRLSSGNGQGGSTQDLAHGQTAAAQTVGG